MFRFLFDLGIKPDGQHELTVVAVERFGLQRFVPICYCFDGLIILVFVICNVPMIISF